MKLVGRDTELDQLRETCRAARDGRGRVVVVTGDAGIGKSALVEELTAELAQTFDTTWGRAWELSDAPAYFPLWPCLKSLGLSIEATRGDVSTFELWEHVLEGLVAAAEKRPVMWVVEDLHVADSQTLDLLAFLAQAIRGLRVVLVTTTRQTDDKRILRLARDGREVRLGPLDALSLAQVAGQWAGRDLLPAEAVALADRTGGNPLFVVECARAGKRLLEAVPPTVASVIGERVDQLPESVRSLVRDAAVLGNEVTAAALAAMRDTLPARVIDDLGAALKSGLVEELAPGRYRFHHALVRDAIEAQLPALARLDAHARAERALAAQPDSPKHAVERARHALASLTPGREQAALAVASHALDVLEQQGTYDRAAALCAQLHALRGNGGLPPATIAELLRGARLALDAGRFAESRAYGMEAANLSRAAGDVEAFAAAALTYAGDVHPGRVKPDATRLLEEARAMLGPVRSPARCQVTARLAAAMQPAVDPQVPIEIAREAIAEAREMGDRSLLEQVLFVAISALTDMVDAEELRDLNREHLVLARELDRTAHLLRGYVRLALAEVELGDFTAFDAHLDEMLRIASAVGHPRMTWRPYLLASMRAIARGQFAESERFMAEVERAGHLTDDPSLSLSFGAHRFFRLLDLHRQNTLEAELPKFQQNVENLPVGPVLMPQLRTVVASRFGDLDAAARAFASFPIDSVLSRQSESAGLLGMLGECVAAAGSAEQRAVMLRVLEPLADRHAIFAHTPMSYSGPLRRVIGLLELANGNRSAGEQHLRRALETVRGLGYATWVARISFELGDLDEAARLAANLGIHGLAKRASAKGGESVAPPTRPALGLVREGSVWRISLGVRVVRVPDNRGMELVAKLVERPGEELHVLVLAGSSGESLAETDAGEALDERAARQYKTRLAAIEGELAGAKGDRAKQLEREREFLTKELARAFGLGNAPRKLASVSERARVNVQRRIKDSLARIAQQDSVIADYLRSAIRTGTYCTFRP